MTKYYLYVLVTISLLAFSLQAMKPSEKENVITVSPISGLLATIQAPSVSRAAGEVKLISNDKQEFTLPLSAAELSQSLREQIADIGSAAPIPLDALNGEQLDTITKSLNALAAITTTQDYGAALAKALDPLFIGMPLTDVIDILKAANYLNIPVLLDYITALISSQLTQDTNISRIATLTQETMQLLADIRSLILKPLYGISALYTLFTKLKKFKAPDEDNYVYAVAFNPKNSTQALIAFGDNTASLLNLKTDETIKELKGHTAFVTSVAISSDGKHALTGSEDQTARLWNLDTGETIKVLEGHSSTVEVVAFSANGKQALSASLDKTVRLWDLDSGKTIKLLKEQNKIVSAALSPDGRYALTNGGYGAAHLWDLATSKLINKLEQYSDVWAVAISPTSKQALAGSFNGTVRLWDLSTGTVIKELKGHKATIRSIAFNPSGRYALTGSEDGIALVWDLNTGETIKELKGHHDRRTVRSVAFNSDSSQVLTGSEDGTVLLWGLPFQPTIAVLVLLHHLANPAIKDVVVVNEYFKTLINTLPADISKVLEERFVLK